MLSSLELSSTARKDMESATAAYEKQLPPEALAYLEERGISAEVVRSARLGVVGEPLPGHEQYRGRLCIPFLTPNGVVALRFRTLGDDSAKYLSLPGAIPRLYGVDALHTGLPHVAITEGEFDALALTQAGLPAVGVPGANSWQPHYSRVFADFERVYVITDNDVKDDVDGKVQPNPGQQLAHKIAKSVKNAVVIVPPANVDVSEWLLRDGAEAVLNKVDPSLVASCSTNTVDSQVRDVTSVDPDEPPF